LSSGTKQLNIRLPLSVGNCSQRNLLTCSIITSKKNSKHKDCHDLHEQNTYFKLKVENSKRMKQIRLNFADLQEGLYSDNRINSPISSAGTKFFK
jgi:hypothetical protein